MHENIQCDFAIIAMAIWRGPHLVRYFTNKCRIIALVRGIIPLKHHDEKARNQCAARVLEVDSFEAPKHDSLGRIFSQLN